MSETAQDIINIEKTDAIASRISKMQWRRDALTKDLAKAKVELKKHEQYIEVAPGVSEALDALSTKLFADVLNIVQEKLTTALAEILGQPIKFRAESNVMRGAAGVHFWVERDGNEEDIIRGQGGSVANILSVGLRMFALATLSPKEHRRFLVLDEQDCWLRAELVPLLVKIIHEASTALGLQTLVISHHNLENFATYADNIIRLERDVDGELKLTNVSPKPAEDDMQSSG